MDKIIMIIALFLAFLFVHPRVSVGQVIIPDINQPQTGEVVSLSRNWSGYVAANKGVYTSVNATWTVPDARGRGSSDATWVGIGGTKTSDLIQAGTENIVDPSGQTQTAAFYEILPDAAILTPLDVNAGDSLTVAVEQTSKNKWLITFVNNTTGKKYEKTLSYVSSLSSAEWVVEAPSTGRSQLPLDNFGTVLFTNAETTKNGAQMGIDESEAIPTVMVIRNLPVVDVSAINNEQNAFAVTRINNFSS